MYKIGVMYELNPDWTLRGGYITLKQPIPTSQTLFNILAPGVVEDHFTFGATWRVSKQSELTFAYMYAPEVKVNGSGSIPPAHRRRRGEPAHERAVARHRLGLEVLGNRLVVQVLRVLRLGEEVPALGEQPGVLEQERRAQGCRMI